MKIIQNDKLIKRNTRIGQIASLAGLGVLALGLITSFRSAELVTLAWASLLLGFILSQVGLHYGNRFGRRPRPDEQINEALKGMDDRYAIYHYKSPASHILVGPAGLWILFPRNQAGKIVYEKGRWRQKGGGILAAYLRLFAQEGLGRPDLDIETEIEGAKRMFKTKSPDLELPEFNPILIFTNEKAIIEADEAPTPAISIKKLKDFIRKTAKEKALNPAKITEICSAIES